MVTNHLKANLINPNLQGEITLNYPNDMSLTGITEFLSLILGENPQEPNLPREFTLHKAIYTNVSEDIYCWILYFTSQKTKYDPHSVYYLENLLNTRGIESQGEDYNTRITQVNPSDFIITIIGII